MGHAEQDELLISRFLSECLLFRTGLGKASVLTEPQWQAVKLKLYDLIFEIETERARHSDPDDGRSNFTASG